MPALSRVGTAFFLGKKSGGGAAQPGEAIFHADKWYQDSTWNATTEYNWIVPAGVTEISVVCVGGGGSGEPRHDGASGGGAGLAYKNNLAVTPGSTVVVRVGGGGAQSNWDNAGFDGIRSEIVVDGIVYANAGGGRKGEDHGTSGYLDNTSYGHPGSATDKYDGGGKGGRGYHQSGCRQSGGGVGGYSNSPDNGNGAEGGDCGNPSYAGTNASGGANGAGGAGVSANGCTSYYASGGGGVGMYGRGANGAAGSASWDEITPTGKGGSYDPWTYDTSGIFPNVGYIHNTGLRGYACDSSWNNWANPGSSTPTGSGSNGTDLLLGSESTRVYRRNNATQGQGQTRPDGGFPGGGGGGGHGGCPAGYGGHGCVRIVWGTINGMKREFPTQGVNKTDEYPGLSGATIDENGKQMMY